MIQNLFRMIMVLLFVITIGYAKQEESEIIEEVQDVYEDIEYLSAEFVQTEQFKLTGSVNETKGKIYIKNGIEYRLETEDHTIVTDGKNVWSFSPHNNKVIIDIVKEGDSSLLPRDMLFKYPKNYYSTLVKTDKLDNQKYYVLKMTPREEIQGYIKSMKIWVNEDTYLIHRLEYVDLNNNTSAFQIKKLDISTDIPDSFFIFNAPPNSEIIDVR